MKLTFTVECDHIDEREEFSLYTRAIEKHLALIDIKNAIAAFKINIETDEATTEILDEILSIACEATKED